MKFKETATLIIGLILIILPVLFVLNLFYHIDPIHQCLIRVDNKSDLTRKAITYLRKYSKDDYKLVCGNVSKVVEISCTVADWDLNPNYTQPACYLRGTKIIYLRPTNTTEENARTLAKLAQFSKEYWETH